MACEVLRQIVRRPCVVVVQIEQIGNTSEAAQALQPSNELGFLRVARALHLGGRRSLVAEPDQLLVDGRLYLFGRVAGTRSGLDIEYRRELQRVLAGTHLLCDLLFVDEFLEETAG